MSKSISFFVFITVGILFFVFFEDNDIMVEESIIKTVKAKEDQESAIIYQSNEKSVELPLQKNNKEIHLSKKEKEVDPRILYRTIDNSGNYGIELIDESNLNIVHGITKTFIGYINNNIFAIKVPLERKDFDLKLKVYDFKNKTSKEVYIPFVTELKPTLKIGELHLQYEDIQNYILKKSRKNNELP